MGVSPTIYIYIYIIFSFYDFFLIDFFFLNGFPTTYTTKRESRPSSGDARRRKTRVHKMATPLGNGRVKLEYKLGKMWLLIS